jgi:hypothetical protein
MKFYHYILAFFNILFWILVPLVLVNSLYYLVGSFIAMDWNPMNWWLLTSFFGRIILVALEIGILVNVPRFWEEIMNS